MVTSAALAVFLVEALKQLIARATGNGAFEFSPKIMAALLVLANAVSALFLAFLGMDGYTIPTDWIMWAKTLAVAILGALVSSGLYVVGYAPFRQYWHEFYMVKKAK